MTSLVTATDSSLRSAMRCALDALVGVVRKCPD